MSTPQQQRVTELLTALFDYDEKNLSSFSNSVQRANELEYPIPGERGMQLENMRFILSNRDSLLESVPQASEQMLTYMEKDLLSTLQYVGYTNTNQSDNPLEYIDPDGRTDRYWFHYSQMMATLFDAQDEAMYSPKYLRGSTGPCNWAYATARTTWCNQATYAIARKTGFDLNHFRGSSGRNLNDVDANAAARNLRENAQSHDSSLVRLDAEQAMRLASEGYTVVGASENFEIDPNTGKRKSGHLATLTIYQGLLGGGDPIFANVGWENGFKTESDAFHGREVEYYYDPTQHPDNHDFNYNIGEPVQ